MSTRDLPDVLLERYAVSEATEEERRLIRERLATDPSFRHRLETIESSNQDILADYPPEAMVSQIAARHQARGDRRPRFFPSLAIAVPAAAIAGVLALAIIPTRDHADLPPASETTRVKGLQPQLFLHRQMHDSSERLDPGTAATEHDVLQMSYKAAGRDHGAIVSIDGRGSVTLHHPVTPDGDTLLLPAGEAALPDAYELDDAPDFERFFLVTTTVEAASLDPHIVLEAAQRLARDLERAERDPLPLPPGLEQTSVLVRKTGGTKP
ncbi:hypothetical protein ACFL6C_02355 [Myxococcota bacterium]